MTINQISRRLFGILTLAIGAAMAPHIAVAQSGEQGGFRPQKMRSIVVNELTVTDPVKYKIYQDQGAGNARFVRRTICVTRYAGTDHRRSAKSTRGRA